MAFDWIPRLTDWLNYIMPREGRLSGLQGAHLFSDKEWESGKRFEFLKQLGFDANHFMNGSFNPETQRGGYVLGTAVHSGKQVGAFDDLQFDNGQDRDTSPRFMNTIKQELR